MSIVAWFGKIAGAACKVSIDRQRSVGVLSAMFKRVLKWLGGIVAVLLVVAAVFLVNLIWFRPWSLNAFYEKIFVEVLFDQPELLSNLGLVEQFGITGHNARLDDESPAQQQRQFERLRKNLAQLHQYPLEKQTASQRLSTAVLDWFLTVQAEGEKFQWHNYPVNQLFGVQNQFPSFMANTHRLFTPRDCDYYLKRLEALPTKFDQVLESLKVREAKGIIPPRFVVEKVLKEMREFVATPAPKNILAVSFQTRARKIEKLNEQQRADYQSRVEAMVTSKVYPAYQKLIDYFTALLPKTTTDDGVWKLPEGEAFYAQMLRQNTTTTLN
ncbi:MAG: DUF885 domain-containing protein, partial [Chthoniobacterales bacterium]|nr:DUF885 domain-containing protein [Chthoniobacterales bacterium]